jgi:hypothetical protein
MEGRPLARGARYGHALIAHDWPSLAAFYERFLGDVVTTAISDGRRVTWCYLTDPEGNTVELQSWSPAEHG